MKPITIGVYSHLERVVCVLSLIEKIRSVFKYKKHIMHEPVKYMMLSEMRKDGVTTDDLPFLKRHAFTDESECRIICPSRSDAGHKHIKFPIDLISKVSVNPWAPNAFFEVIRETIKNISGCEKVEVRKSSLLDNKEWRRFGDKIS